MAKKLQPPCAAPKRGIPWELKYIYAKGAWISIFKGLLFAIREEYGAAAAIKLAKRLWEREDRVKNMTNTILNVFNIEGNDAETIAKWFDIWFELFGYEYTTLERSKTIDRRKFTKCAFVTEHKDVSDWDFRFCKIAAETINPKSIFEMPKTMCAGDPYCDFIFRIEK